MSRKKLELAASKEISSAFAAVGHGWDIILERGRHICGRLNLALAGFYVLWGWVAFEVEEGATQ